MRKLLALALIVGLLLAGDAWARATAERRVTAELRRSLGGSEDTTVALGGFPFLFGAISGNISSATVTSGALVRDGVRLRGLSMTLQDLTFSVEEIAAGSGSIRVREGRGRASIDPGSLMAAFDDLPGPLDIEVGRNGLKASLGPVAGRADLSLEGTELVLTVGVIDRTFRAPLPKLLEGISYDSVRVSGSTVRLGFSLRDATLQAR